MDSLKTLITLGGTREYTDPVRYIGNNSSGKMGLAIINQLLSSNHSAQITAIVGTNEISETDWPKSPNFSKIDVETVSQMHNAVFDSIKRNQPDIFISVAAVCDYRAKNFSKEKIKKIPGQDEINITFVKNPDILYEVAQLKSIKVVVGFALETAESHDELIEKMTAKLNNKKLDIIVGNGVDAISSNDNSIIILNNNGQCIKVNNQSKDICAKFLVEEIMNCANAKNIS